MANTLSLLLDRVRSLDPDLASRLSREIDARSKGVGLVFENHEPEAVALPGLPVRRHRRVSLLPPRGVDAEALLGSRKKADRESVDPLWGTVWTVEVVAGGRARLTGGPKGFEDTIEWPVADLVVMAEFRDPIYPGLVSEERVELGGDKPFHTVINAENYHALEMLTYTHRGKVDAIYIDPPYNTGARDWKYNNNYVESQDGYRHSKWLAFMQRRLLRAKDLLNPDNSVLIVTIDEKEYLRLGMLLEQTFPEANIQMVTSSIKPSGSQRGDAFSRVEEYLFFLMFGDARPGTSTTDMLRDADDEGKQLASVTWQGLRRRGSTDWKRSHRPNGFYPVFIARETGAIHSVGDAIPLEQDRHTVAAPDGTWAAWPLDPKGQEGRWQVSPERLRAQLAEATAVLRSAVEETGACSIVYLKGGDLKLVRSGAFEVDGLDAEGKQNVVPTRLANRKAKTMWVMPSHDSSAHGTALLSRFLGVRKFPFPKSLYAVEDALRFFVEDKPDAVILDFFSGSGTTAHAVMRLNRQDNGRRQCISVTNNEVSADEQSALRAKGLRPGDPEWEQWGICDYITKPRIRAAITGLTPEGAPINGDYKFTDEFPMSDGFEENVEFLTLTYGEPDAIEVGESFEAIAPLLWIRAGSQGQRIDEIDDRGYAIADTYAILFDVDQQRPFLNGLDKTETVRLVYVVTDYETEFARVATALPPGVEAEQLYSSYLSNFEIS